MSFIPSRYEDDELGIWSWYFPLSKKIDEVSEELSSKLAIQVTPRDVGKAIWYYKSCQSLVSQFRSGLKWRFTPQTLLKFLSYRRWTLGDLADRIGDIDEIDLLASELRALTEDL